MEDQRAMAPCREPARRRGPGGPDHSRLASLCRWLCMSTDQRKRLVVKWLVVFSGRGFLPGLLLLVVLLRGGFAGAAGMAGARAA